MIKSRVFVVITLCSLVALSQCSKKSPTASNPALSLSSISLIFQPGETSKQITIGNSGGGELTWSAFETIDVAWLSLSPSSGQAGNQLNINVNLANLNSGSHNASIQITSNGGDENLAITVLISELLISSSILNFESSENTKDLQIQNAGAGNLNWTISTFSSIPWLSMSANSGENTAVVTVTIDRNLASGGRHSEILLINSTGGNEEIAVSFSNLPSSIVLEEFSSNAANWDISSATSTVNNGFLELTGTSATSFGQAAFTVTPTRAAPWLFRAAIGRKIDFDAALSSMGMITNDTGTIIIPAFRFDIMTDSEVNWIAAAFAINNDTGEGLWGHFEGGFGKTSVIKTGSGEINDISLAMKSTKVFEVYVDGNLFFQTDEILSLEIDINEEITVDLENVFIWANLEVTTITDWALIRDVDTPGKRILRDNSQSANRQVIMDYARQKAQQQFKSGSLRDIPSLKQAIDQIR